MHATKNIHTEWYRKAKEEYRQRREAEKPEDRDRRIWLMSRDHDLSMDPASWTPHNSTYTGPNYDPKGNIIPRHTGYSGCSSESSFDRGPRPAERPEEDINNEYEAEAADAPLPEESYDVDC